MTISGDNPTINGNNAYVQCSVLLPKRKLELLPVQFTQFLMQISDAYGGYTLAGEAAGTWIERSTGIQYSDSHLVILVAIPDQQLYFQQLKKLIADAARELQEIAIFLAVAGGMTIFVWSSLHRYTALMWIFPHSKRNGVVTIPASA